MRLLVCGGREWRDRGAVYRFLTMIHDRKGIDVLIHGGARGADRLADDWAKMEGIPRLPFPVPDVEWRTFGKVAGHLRNQRMLDIGKPDGVVAFPGGTGTADMCRRAEAAGIKVWRPLG